MIFTAKLDCLKLFLVCFRYLLWFALFLWHGKIKCHSYNMYRVGDIDNPGTYHLISAVLVVAKVLEKLITNQFSQTAIIFFIIFKVFIVRSVAYYFYLISRYSKLLPSWILKMIVKSFVFSWPVIHQDSSSRINQLHNRVVWTTCGFAFCFGMSNLVFGKFYFRQKTTTWWNSLPHDLFFNLPSTTISIEHILQCICLFKVVSVLAIFDAKL